MDVQRSCRRLGLEEVAGRFPYETGEVLVRDAVFGLPRPPGAARRQRRSGLWGTAAFLVAAIATGLAFWLLFVRVPIDNPVRTQGSVESVASGGRGGCSVVATFTAAGRQWSARSRVSTSALCSRSPGSPVTVIYDRANPASAEVATGSPWMVVLTIAVPLVFLALAVAFAVRPLGRLRLGRELMRSGPPTNAPGIEAEVTEILYRSTPRRRGGIVT